MMKYQRIDPGQETLLFECSWEEDQQFRMEPGALTALLREQVPVVDFVQFHFTSIEPGRAESVLPLNPQSTNQHFTHQGALILLAAEYTGGAALASLMPGWPVVGVHPVCSSKSMSMWLLRGEIKYLRPSVADLTISAEIAPDRRARLQRRFLQGKPVVERIRVRAANGDVEVAEATLTYFTRQSEVLRSGEVAPEKINVLYQLQLTSSAEMIAGVRARGFGRLFQDPYSARMAGQHGTALAARFCEKLPQLAGMVAARTRHLDAQVKKFAASGGRQLVLLGVGWDMRPFRLRLPEGMRVYELDFPTTLLERRRRLAELQVEQPPGVTRIQVPVNLRTTPLASALEDHVDPKSPVFVAWEGMSMYFQEDEVRNVLRGMAPLFEHPASLLWVDLADGEAVTTPQAFPGEVQQFMRGMQILGEPFTFGTGSVEAFMAGNGFRCHDVVPSDVFLKGNTDPVYSLYRFCLASRGAGVPAPAAASVKKVRLDAESTVRRPGDTARTSR